MSLSSLSLLIWGEVVGGVVLLRMSHGLVGANPNIPQINHHWSNHFPEHPGCQRCQSNCFPAVISTVNLIETRISQIGSFLQVSIRVNIPRISETTTLVLKCVSQIKSFLQLIENHPTQFSEHFDLSCFCPASAHLAKGGFFSATSAATACPTSGLGSLEAGRRKITWNLNVQSYIEGLYIGSKTKHDGFGKGS